MTIESWKEEFYPVKANKRMTDKEALEHALKKFDGASRENLEKHNVVLYDRIVYDPLDLDKVFEFNDKTCSLCRKYMDNGCKGCPLDTSGDNCQGVLSSYNYFCDEDDPIPMIENLKHLLKKEKNK